MLILPNLKTFQPLENFDLVQRKKRCAIRKPVFRWRAKTEPLQTLEKSKQPGKDYFTRPCP